MVLWGDSSGSCYIQAQQDLDDARRPKKTSHKSWNVEGPQRSSAKTDREVRAYIGNGIDAPVEKTSRKEQRVIKITFKKSKKRKKG